MLQLTRLLSFLADLQRGKNLFESPDALLQILEAPSNSNFKGTGYQSLQFHRRLIALSDLLALTAAWFITCALRMLSNHFFAKQFSFAQMTEVAPPLFALLGLWTLIEFRDWLRAPESLSWVGHGLLGVLERALIAGVLAIVATFFSRHFGAELSRSFVLLFLPISFICLIIDRYCLALTMRTIQARWPKTERVAILGRVESAGAIAVALQESDPRSVIVGLIVDQPTVENDPTKAVSFGSHNVLGTTRDLAALINTAHLHRIVLVDGVEKIVFERCAEIAARMGVIVNLIVGMPSLMLTPKLESKCGPHLSRYGLGLLRLESAVRTPWQNATKRAIDLVGSLTLLLLTLPLFLGIALLIRITSPGPILYESRRVGRGGRHFTFLKFRSMYAYAKDPREMVGANEKSGHIFKMRNDPRVTPIGRFLRRTSLDELPQLLNVLQGHMSLVGPRPLPARDLDPDGMSRNFVTWAEQRATVLPGITGLWQIRGRSELSFEDMVNLDLEYIRCWSLGFDLRILLETPLALMTASGAY